MGGFARRASYWSAFARKYPNRPFLKLDGGSIFSVGAVESPVANRWMLEGAYRSGLDALSLSAWDLPVWQEMADLAKAGQIPAEWLNVPLVSANVKSRLGGFPAVERYIIKEFSLGPGAPRKLRIGITSLLHDPEERISRSDFEVLEPEKAARQVIDELEPRTDYRILLTDQAMGPALSLAIKTPGINLLLITHNYSTISEAQQMGDTLVMMPVNEGRMISEVRMSLDAASGKLNVIPRLVPLEKAVPDDPAMGELVRKATEEIEKAKQGR